MREEIITAMQQMIQGIIDKNVVVGSIPPLNGYAVGAVGGSPIETFRPLTSNENLPVLFNGKSSNQQVLMRDMERVHHILTTSKVLPYNENWQIYAIETTSAPNLIGREQNKNWIYGSSFRGKIFCKKGAKQ